jgi:hypothetical protein
MITSASPVRRPMIAGELGNEACEVLLVIIQHCSAKP